MNALYLNSVFDFKNINVSEIHFQVLTPLIFCLNWRKKKKKNKKNQHSVPQRAEFAAAHGMQAKLVLWVVLEEHGFSWFPQNKDALQCPQRNYLEKLMQTFDRKEGRKG